MSQTTLTGEESTGTTEDESDDEDECLCERTDGLGCFEHYQVEQEDSE